MNDGYEKSDFNNDVVISSKISIRRNIAKYNFPNRLSDKGAEQLINEIFPIINSMPNTFLEKCKYINLSETSLNDKKVLYESGIITEKLLKNKRISGVAIFDTYGISILLNEDDHIVIQVSCEGMNLKEAYEIANKIDDFIEEKVEYAFSPKFGYLCSNVSNIGTGLNCSYTIHLPALQMYNQLQLILQVVGKFGIMTSGWSEDGVDLNGSIVDLSNQIAMGVSEEEIISNINNVTEQIINQERNVRNKLYSNNKLYLEDKIYRSYGILKYARNMNFKESIELLSDIRLGIELKIFKNNISSSDIYILMKKIQPANVERYIGKKLKKQEIEVVRAKIIRKDLKSLFDNCIESI